VKTLGDLDETLWMMTIIIIIIIPSQQYPWHFMDDDTLQQIGLEYFVDDLIDWSKSDWNTGWMDGWMMTNCSSNLDGYFMVHDDAVCCSLDGYFSGG
jgi:hypothetical protein